MTSYISHYNLGTPGAGWAAFASQDEAMEHQRTFKPEERDGVIPSHMVVPGMTWMAAGGGTENVPILNNPFQMLGKTITNIDLSCANLWIIKFDDGTTARIGAELKDMIPTLEMWDGCVRSAL